MQAHPSYRDPQLSHLLTKYPTSSHSLFQTYNDVTFSQKWTQVETVDIPELQRGVIRGFSPSHSSDTPTTPSLVLPCSLSESLTTSLFKNAFSTLRTAAGNGKAEPEALFLAICAEDSSIVYYKISNGIVKPPV
ncbi:Sen15 protein-domain-containing protein [Phlebopus sp. FC_14]|nr:Sen15 protein-domain-containing protein [Phlebopus sp. FC_14]